MTKSITPSTLRIMRAEKRMFVLLGGALLMSACAQSGEPAEPYRVISDQAEFASLFVDKPFSKGSDTVFAINSDGTVGGSIGGNTPTGTWEWKDDTYCREFKLGGKDFPYGCQKVEVQGTTARFTRPDGHVSGGWQLGA